MTTVQRDLSTAYMFTQHLCTGTGCVLYKCTDSRGRSCVAKVFPRTDQGILPYTREVSILKQLRHPHIIRLIDFANFPDSHVLISKDGGSSLFDFALANESLPGATIRQMGRSMCAAIQHLHLRNIVHGDIKPENLVIDAKGRVRLIDFGLSQELMPGKTLNSRQIGSLFYQAPEVITERPHTAKIDVWGLGITVFALATSHFPFTTEDEYANMCEVLMEPPDMGPLKANHSPEFVEVTNAMLEKEPNKRPTITQCLEFPWFKEYP
jgi:serine/threonine protein kinase